MMYIRMLSICVCSGNLVVPRLYFVPESELDEGGTAAGSMVTFRDVMYTTMEPMMEDVPFQWAQALYLITRLTSTCVWVTFKRAGLKGAGIVDVVPLTCTYICTYLIARLTSTCHMYVHTYAC